MEGKYFLYRSAEVNGKRQNRCVQIMKCLTDSKRAEQGKQSLLGSLFVYIGVFSNDFAAVDVREELCYHSRPKKQNSEILYNERIVSTVFFLPQ